MSDFDLHQLLSRLTALDTSVDHDEHCQIALDIIADALPASFERSQFSSAHRTSNFWYPADRPAVDVLICAHIDVVPGAAGQFKLRREGDRLYARGVYDMKGPLVSAIAALHHYHQSAIPAPLTIGLLVTSDEEVGGQNGTGAFLKEYPDLKPKIVIVPDGGYNLGIVTEQKGVLDIETTFTGQAAHSARPWEGTNAALKASRAVEQISRRFPDGSVNDWLTTAVVTELAASGPAYNAVANTARLHCNVRFIADDNPDDIVAFFEQLDEQAQCRILQREPALKTAADDPRLELFRQVAQDITGIRPVLGRYPSTSDARYFQNRAETILITRPLGDNAHGDDEWISRDGLESFTQLLAAYLKRLPEALT